MSAAKCSPLRLQLVTYGFFLAIILVAAKLFYIQVILHKEYENKALNQHWNSKILTSRRGDILSSDGFPLATAKDYYLVYAEPKNVKVSLDYAEQLAPLLINYSLDKPIGYGNYKNSIKERLEQKAYWVQLEKKIPEEVKDQITSLNLAGIGFESQPLRYYPEGTLASQVLGFVASSDKADEQGYFGIEGYFDGDLKGREGKILEEKGADGKPILTGGYKKIPPQRGRNLILTINRSMQFLVEKKLKEGVEKYKAKNGTVVVVNPETGDILAMATYPSFSPMDLDKESSMSLRKNIAIEEVYEPGSIMKPLTVASAVDLGLVTKDTTFNDDGPKVYSGYSINNWNGKHLGVQTVAQLLEKSNNIGAAWVGEKVGREKLHSYFKNFGLGTLTGITLEGENTGSIRDTSEWTDIDLATASFGQGVSASVLQMAMAFTVFDNEGVLMKPRIVSQIVDENRTIDFQPKKNRQVISKKTAAAMNEMLVLAVDNGESRFFNIKGYSVAGKTGTAQIPVNGKYDPSKTNASFVGYLPKAPSGKKFVMIVKLTEPTTSTYASETAVPLWMSILRDIVVMYKIPPDK